MLTPDTLWSAINANRATLAKELQRRSAYRINAGYHCSEDMGELYLAQIELTSGPKPVVMEEGLSSTLPIHMLDRGCIVVQEMGLTDAMFEVVDQVLMVHGYTGVSNSHDGHGGLFIFADGRVALDHYVHVQVVVHEPDPFSIDPLPQPELQGAA